MRKKIIRAIALVLCVTLLSSCFYVPCKASESSSVKAEVERIDSLWKRDPYSLRNMAEQKWYRLAITLSDAYQTFTKLFRSKTTGSKDLYEEVLVNFLYDSFDGDNNALTDKIENISESVSGGLSVTEDVMKYIEGMPKEVLDAASKANLGVDIISCGVDDFIYLEENMWILVRLASEASYTQHALEMIKEDTHNYELKAAAKNVLRDVERLQKGNETDFGETFLSNTMKDDAAKMLMQQGVSAVVGFYTATVSLFSLALDAGTDTGNITKDLQRYDAYMILQDHFRKALLEIEMSDYASEEDFLRDYRMLAYAYVKCARDAHMLFMDWDGLSDELKESVKVNYYDTLTNIMIDTRIKDTHEETVEEIHEETEEISDSDYTEEYVEEFYDDQTDNSDGSGFGIKNYGVPSALSEEDTFVCYGQVYSSNGQGIQEVTVNVRRRNGDTVLKASSGYLGNATSYEVMNLDSQIYMNHLPAGDYLYEIYAAGELLVSSPFSVAKENGNFIIYGYRLPKPMPQGNTFVVTGKVKSAQRLRTVSIEFYSVDSGSTVDSVKGYADGYSFDLNSLDRNVLFDRLGRGNYIYKVVAENVNGEKEVLVAQPFYIY